MPQNKLELKQPRLVMVGAVAYLCQVQEDEKGKLKLVDAHALNTISELTKEHLNSYVEAYLRSKLTTLELGGQTSYSCQELDSDMSLQWNITVLQGNQALEQANGRLVATTFNHIVKGQ